MVEQFSRMVERHGLQEGFRAEAGPAGEEFLQAGRRFADFLGKRLERGLVAIVEADLLDDTADDLVVAADRGDVALQDLLVWAFMASNLR